MDDKDKLQEMLVVEIAWHSRNIPPELLIYLAGMKDARDRTTAEKDEWPLTPISLFSPFFKGTAKHMSPNLWIGLRRQT